MNMIWIKIVSIVIIFGTGLLAGLIPRRLSVVKGKTGFLVWGNAFAGGVFLGAGLLHMLPDGIENLSEYFQNIDYPVAPLLTALGFLLILILEKALLRGQEGLGEISEDKVFFPYILCFILSVHSIITGISLGLEIALISAIAIFIAVIGHKGAAAFALGVSLKKNGIISKKYLGLISFFSIMTPLGIVLGTIFTVVLSNHMSVLLEGVFDSIAAGTFLYVAIVDIIQELFEQKQDNWKKVFWIISGFALMALVAIWS